MIRNASRVRAIVVAVFTALSASTLGGCGGLDGVDFNGKIFDAVGLSTGSVGKKTEVATQPRAPLVLPPDANRLPDPGEAPPALADQSWPKDPQRQKIASAEARKKAQEDFCQNESWKNKAMNKGEATNAQGPDGPCGGSIFSFMGSTIFGSND